MKIYSPALLVTMDREHRVIADGAVAVEGKLIRDLGRAGELRSRWPDAEPIDTSGQMILPGFINTHTHLFQVLFRGIGLNLPVAEWLAKVIFTLGAYLGREECYQAASLASAEMLHCGVTTFVDSHYITVDRQCWAGIAQAIEEVGIRGVLGRSTVDTELVAPEYRESVEEAVDGATEVIERYHGQAECRLSVRVEPLNEALASQSMVVAMRELSRKHQVGFSMHAAETRRRIEDCRSRYGRTTVEWLHELGVLGPDALLSHCVWVSPREIELLAGTQTKVAHNSVANQYLADGAAPVKEMLEAGVTVAIATDGASTNNGQNILEAMKCAVLLQRTRTLDPAALSAAKALEMITIDAARAIGMEESLGSIEPGKLADLVFLDLNVPQFVPRASALANLVFAAPANAVTRVMVDGAVVFEHGRVLRLDERSLVRACNQSVDRILEKSRLGEHIRDPYWRFSI
jgi:5-methylthioadenosine/S-adenosylhomocysteine deaminase